MQKGNTTYTKYLIVIGILLAILALIFFNTYAKYIDEGSGEDDSRGTVFAVDASDESSAAVMPVDSSVNKTLDASDASVAYYSFAVSNTKDDQVSEAALEYDIVVDLKSQSLTGVNLTIVDEDGTVVNPDSSSTEYVKYFKRDAWELPASTSTTRNLRLCFSLSSGATVDVYNGIQVRADFRQVD